MNKKRAYIISGFILLLFVSSYIYGLIINHSGERDFAISKDIEVQAIHIVPPEAESIFIERAAHTDKWRIDENHFANEYVVNDLIRTMRHCAVRQPVSLDKTAEVNENLDDYGIMVDIYFDDYLFNFYDIFGLVNIKRKARSIIVGENVEEIEGTYMRKHNSNEPYIVYLPGYSKGIAAVFTPVEHIWYDPEIVDLEPKQIKQVKVDVNQKPGESFMLKTEEDFTFNFYDLENNPVNDKFQPDTVKVLSYLSSFDNLYYETLLKGDDYKRSEKLIFPEYAFDLTIVDRKHNYYSFKAYRKHPELNQEEYKPSLEYDPDRFYIELEDGSRAIAKYFVFGRVFRGLSFFKPNS